VRQFKHFDAKTVEEAIAILSEYENARIIAGGQDVLTLLKDKVRGPKFGLPDVVVNIKNIPELIGVRETADGLEIGALTILSDIESHPTIQEQYGVLAKAAGEVGTPQVRNVGTLGGNLCQRPRCWYFRRALFDKCYKKGGDFCFAVTGENSYHCILKGELCYVVHPSDTAPALMALNASVKIAGPDGVRTVPLDEFFIGPREDVLHENVLQPNEVLTQVQVPTPTANTRGAFVKVKERRVLDFALVSLAAVVSGQNGTIDKATLVLGSIAPTPYRATEAEKILEGGTLNEALAQRAGEAVVMGARPMSQNAYKVDIVKGLVQQTLLSLA